MRLKPGRGECRVLILGPSCWCFVSDWFDPLIFALIHFGIPDAQKKLLIDIYDTVPVELLVV